MEDGDLSGNGTAPRAKTAARDWPAWVIAAVPSGLEPCWSRNPWIWPGHMMISVSTPAATKSAA